MVKESMKFWLNKLKPKTSWFFYAFILGLMVRGVLFIINDQRNDDHIEPILMWQETGEFPETHECWECFQPKLFYAIIKTANSFFKAGNDREVYLLVQLFNFLYGALLLWLILRFIESLNLRKWTTIALMLFWSLNPELVSINVLASNDTLLFLLGFIIVYLTNKLISKNSLTTDFLLFITLLIAGMTKGNSLAFLGLYIAFVILQISLKKAGRLKAIVVKSSLVLALIVSYAYGGRYVEKYQTYGNAFKINVQKSQPAKFMGHDTTESIRYGVKDIRSALIDFPLLSLLKEPYNLNDWTNSQKHRQNIWTQYFGQFTNYMFECYPSKWASINNEYLNFARANIIVHLLLFLVFISGCIAAFKRVSSKFYSKDLVHLVCLAAFLVFGIIYAVDYRDFSFMKVMFLFPVYMSLIYLFALGIKQLKYLKLINGLLFTAVILYQLNFLYLVKALL
jgi:hypothetical protein